jgi:F-type H+-transporting ATPase subunit alpha
VGGAAQIGAMKQVARALKIELANYRELQAFAQFGSDLDPSTKKILNHGQVLLNVLKQVNYKPKKVDRQILELFAVQQRFLEEVTAKDIPFFLDSYVRFIEQKHPEVIDEIKKVKKFSDATLAKLKTVTKAYFDSLMSKA